MAEKQNELLLIGSWYRHLDSFDFSPDGTYSGWQRGIDGPKSGTWRLHGQTLTLTENGKTWTHRIISISKSKLEMTFGDDSPGLEYNRGVD